MHAHLRYLRYVLRHKFYVARAWFVIAELQGYGVHERLTMCWRALVHDLSKFSRAEWGPYVATFYGESARVIAFREYEASLLRAQMVGLVSAEFHEELKRTEILRIAEIERERQASFNYAWLHHQHRNPHHWQHWVLREDSGKTIVLLPHAMLVDEMVADWMAAGPKANSKHSVAFAVAETIAWYAKVYDKQQLRSQPRARAEQLLMLLAHAYGIAQHAAEVQQVAETRRSIVIPGR